MLSQIPGSQDDPFFCIYRQGCWISLTDRIVRNHFKHITRILGWEHRQVIFQTFRRSGASWAFQHRVPIEVIKIEAHGLLTVCGNIFTQRIIWFPILSYKPSNYTYPIDGCLGEFILCLLSCLILIYSNISKKIKGNFPLGILGEASL